MEHQETIIDGHIFFSHRHAIAILKSEYESEYNSILDTINSLSDEDIKSEVAAGFNGKSLAETINDLLENKFSKAKWLDSEGKVQHWEKQKKVFKQEIEDDDNKKIKSNPWSIDFASKNISLEVAFNNAGSAAWNIIKPLLASEKNHVPKEFSTKIGIIVCASEELKIVGGFDGAIGAIGAYKTRLYAMYGIVNIPLLLIGLRPFKKIHIEHSYDPLTTKITGELVDNTQDEKLEAIIEKCSKLINAAKKEQSAAKKAKKNQLKHP